MREETVVAKPSGVEFERTPGSLGSCKVGRLSREDALRGRIGRVQQCPHLVSVITHQMLGPTHAFELDSESESERELCPDDDHHDGNSWETRAEEGRKMLVNMLAFMKTRSRRETSNEWTRFSKSIRGIALSPYAGGSQFRSSQTTYASEFTV